MNYNSKTPDRNENGFDNNLDEFDFAELIIYLYSKRAPILAICILTGIIAALVSYTFVDMYKVETTITSADQETNQNTIANQLGLSAPILGMNIGAITNSKINNSLAILRSRDFLVKFIDHHDLYIPLFAGVWDKTERLGKINKEIFDKDSGKWFREEGAPTAQEAFVRFSEALEVSSSDPQTNLVNISLSWHDPELASQWLNNLIDYLNKEVKTRDVKEASAAIAYLTNQLEVTALLDMQRVFYEIIESQTRIVMLADVREEYVFRVIDRAIPPQDPVSPDRLFVFLSALLIGGIGAVLFYSFKYYFETLKGYLSFRKESIR